jgi:archaellum component FlaF (FlaF/FlaG flagellin family)
MKTNNRRVISWLLYSTLIILLSLSAAGQEFEEIFYEGFENDGKIPSGWTQQFVFGSRTWRFENGGYAPSGAPTFRHPASAYAGSYNALFQDESIGPIRRLVTPSINLVPNGAETIKPTLTFWHAQDSWGGATDELKIYYRRSSADGWVLIEHYTATTTNWTLREILLPDDAKTETCQIAFEGISNWGWGVCVDEVRIEERGRLDRKVEYFDLKQKSGTIPSGSTVNPFGNILALVSGNNLDIPLNSITINYTGTDIADIDQLTVYHTRDSIFSVSSKIPASINISGNEITITAPTFNLQTGNNYIWFTFDVSPEAEHGNSIDFSLAANSVLLGENTFPSTAQDPSSIATIHESLKFSNFSSDNTWTKTDLWEIGEPQGVGIYDPNFAYSGSNVLATNLTGNYSPSIEADVPETATTQPINAKFYQNLTVRYRRWLNIEYFDKTSVKISNDDGATWTNIFQNNTGILDRSWQPISTNISQWATRKENVRIMFSMDTTNQFTEYGGWNIDNFAITGEFIHSDVGITNLIAPYQTCGLTNTEEVKVTLRNFGGATVDVPFDIGYSLDGGATYVREEYSTSLESEADPEGVYELEYTFTTLADFSSPGLKNLRFKTFLDGDQDTSNDMFQTSIYVFPTVAYPYQTSFESNNAYWNPSGTNSSWQWGTPTGTLNKTASNGTRVWATSLSGNYNHNELSYLESPCFDLTTAEMPVISFDYIMQVEQNNDGLSLEYSIDGGATWNILPADGNYSSNWFDTPEVTSLGTAGWSVNKSQYVTAKNLLPNDVVGVNGVKFRFVFGSNATTRSEGVALDMIRVYELPYDVGITELISPTDDCEIGNNVPLELKLENFGYRTVPQDAQIPIVVQVDGGATKTETITITADITQNSEYTFTTTNTFNLFSAGEHEIVAYTNLEVDDNNTNNTHETSIEVLGMPEFTLGPDIGVEDFTTPVTLDAGEGYTSYSWFELPEDVTSIGSDRFYDVSDEGDYRVVVTKYIDAELTCEAQDDVSVMLSDKDVGVADITNLEDACEHDSPISPQIVIQSFRNSPFDEEETIPLVVEVDGEVVLTEDFTPAVDWGTLNETTPYTFTGTIDLSEDKTYNISIYTNLSKDLERSNDEKSVSVATFGIPEVIILTRTEQEPDVFEAVSEIITTSADTLLLKANDGFSSYQWERKKPDETIWTSLTSGQTYTPSSKNTFEYRVTVVDPNGCGTPETNNEIVLVDAYDLSLISINNQTEGMCHTSETVPLSITLKNSGQDVYPIGTVITVVANTPMGNQNETITLDSQLGIGAELEYEFPQEVSLPMGENFLSFSAATNNDPDTSNNELSITTTVSPTPTVSIEPSTLYKVFDQYEVYEIVPTYSEPYTEEDIYTYSWHDGTTDSTYLVYNPSDFPIYEVTVENSFGCTASSSMTIISADLQVASIVSPSTDCGLADATPVTISIKNNGNTTYTTGTDIDVDLYLDGTLVTTETITLTEDFAAKSTKNFTLNQTLDLSTVSNATIQVDISTAAEEVHYDNNTRNKSVYALGFPSPNLGADRDIYAWQEELDPGYYDMYLWQDESTERILTATENGTYTVTVTDFSGCQGSDEVTLTFYKDDIELLEVLEPATGCGLSSQEAITFKIQNNGNYPIPVGRVIDLGYTHESIDYPESYTLAEEIAVGGVFEVTLSQTIDLSQPKEHSVLFWVDMDKDGFDNNNNIILNINSYPEVNLSLNYADGTVSNVPLVLDAGEGYSAYQWTYNSTNVSTEQTYTANQSGTYGVLVTDGNGCQGYQEIDVTILMPDYSIAEIISPISSCVLGTSNQVEVKVANIGTDKLTAGEEIEIELWHNQALVATESFTMESNLEPSQTFDITLAHTLDLSTASEHTIAAKVIAPIDRNSANDSLAIDIYAWGNPVVDLGDDRVIKNGSLVLDAGAEYESYLWQDGSSEQTFTVTETGNYNVTVVDENGCEGSDAVRIDVLTPDYSISAMLSPTSDCELTSNETITLEITNTGTDTLVVNDILPITVLVNTTEIASEEYVLDQRLEPEQKIAVTLTTKADLSQATSYEFIATVSHPLDNNTSNNTLTKIIEHYPNPEVDLGEDLITYDPVVLDAGAGYASYLWQDDSENQTLTATQTGDYHVTVISEYGCVGYDEIHITLLVADYSVTGITAPTSGCELTSTEPISIDISNLGTDTLRVNDLLPITFKVMGQDVESRDYTLTERIEPGGKGSITLNAELDLSEVKSYELTAIVSHPLDKNSDNNALTTTVEHYPNPEVDLGDDFVAYNPVTLDAGEGLASYLWQDGSTSQTLTASETGLYSVTVTNEYGCEGYDEINLSFDYSSRIYVANIISPSAQACEDDELTVEITIENQRNQTIEAGTELTANYRLSDEETVSETITLDQALEHKQTINYTFAEKFEAEDGTPKLSTWIDFNERVGKKTELNLTINPTPDLDLGDDLEVTFPYTIESGISNVDYLWSTNETTSSITVDNPGEYWLTVTNDYGCEASDTITLTVTSVQVIPGTNTVVSVFPNPADQWISVSVEAEVRAKFIIELVSPSGQKVYSHTTEQNQSFTHRIDVTPFASGVYIIRVLSGDEWITVRLAIQR